MQQKITQAEQATAPRTPPISRLAQWPCQLRLVPANAPYLDGANLLIAADCTAYACASFHQDFMRGHITLIGCPRLDGTDYLQKLTEILTENNVKSITLIRMEVPCCNGMEGTVRQAIRASEKSIPCEVITMTTDGKIVK